ncbi:MAG: type IX secretion system protein PorQ [Bacteroidales bacterium]|nr:type IX secretion system protein PorQ [Bacteroidales bacterium]
MTRFYLYTFFFTISLFTNFLSAQNTSSAFNFLSIAPSSRANALGGVNISVVEKDLSLVVLNPSLLGKEMTGTVSLNYMHYISDINLGAALYAIPFLDRGALAFGASFLDYGNFKLTSPSNEILGDFSAKDMNFHALVGYDISERWRGGAQTKLLYSVYDTYSSIALAVDLGINYFNPYNEFSFSATIKNLGAQLKQFNDIRETLPYDFQIGVSKMLAHAPLRFSLTGINLLDYDDDFIVDDNVEIKTKNGFIKKGLRHLVFAGEFIPNDNFYFALGYNYGRNFYFNSLDSSPFAGFSCGAGVKIKAFDINASVARYNRSGTSLLITVNTNINYFR